MSITTKIDDLSPTLKEKAKIEGWWDGNSPFDWTQIIGQASKFPPTKLASPQERYSSGLKLLQAKSGKFQAQDMFEVLRHTQSCICRPYYSKNRQGNPTTGSMVNLLKAEAGSLHWFTATPDPSRSVFKPFRFDREDNFSLTESPLAFPSEAQVCVCGEAQLVKRSKNSEKKFNRCPKYHGLWRVGRSGEVL